MPKKGRYVAKKTFEAVVARDGMVCGHCGCAVRFRVAAREFADDVLEIDHVVPLCDGGGGDIDNLMVSCQLCNRSLGSKRRVAA